MNIWGRLTFICWVVMATFFISRPRFRVNFLSIESENNLAFLLAENSRLFKPMRKWTVIHLFNTHFYSLEAEPLFVYIWSRKASHLSFLFTTIIFLIKLILLISLRLNWGSCVHCHSWRSLLFSCIFKRISLGI